MSFNYLSTISMTIFPALKGSRHLCLSVKTAVYNVTAF